MNEVRRVFRPSNLGVLIYAVLNGMVLWKLWALMNPAASRTGMGNLTFAAVYLLCACISMSGIGEWTARLLMGARRVTRRDWNARLTPMLQEVRRRVADEYQYELDDVRIYYVYDPLPSAFALGQRTICVSTALMESSDEVIRAAVAQQTGRILNYDSMFTLFVTVGNVLVLGLLLIVQAIRTVVTVVGLLVTRSAGGRIAALLLAALTWIPVLIVNVILQVSYLIINLSDQRKTYEADAVAVRLGYGQGLIRAIEEMDVQDASERRNLWGMLNRPHPGSHERIGRIQAAMAEAGSGSRQSGRRQAETRRRGTSGGTGRTDSHTRSVLGWMSGGEPARPTGTERPAEPAPPERPVRARTFHRLN